MTAEQVLATLRARGARIDARGGRLHIEAPKGALDAGLKAALVAHKAELVDLLAISSYRMIAATFGDIAGFWIAGAQLPAPTLEYAIDEAATTGDLNALAAALSVYKQAAQDACARTGSKLSGGTPRTRP
jgi:hypothetical protein